jgi:hypothetical protein
MSYKTVVKMITHCDDDDHDDHDDNDDDDDTM